MPAVRISSMATKKEYHLLNNSRFYILVSSLLLSLAVVASLRLAIPNDQVFYIRSQQVFGLLCIFYWYVALAISPIGHVIGKHRTKRLEFARRAIGVSAFYFALLHTLIALFGQLGGFGQLAYLPDVFKWSLIGGLVALIVLSLLAITSFDRVIKFMTFRRWKWLHRFIYIGGILAMLHIWTIGTHMVYGGVQTAAFLALAVLAGLELYRISKLINDKYLRLSKTEALTMFVAIWLIVVALIMITPSFIKNYHSRHHSHSLQQEGSSR